MADSYDSVDVVIPTLNCAANLERCLSSIERQEYRGEITVLVIDGGSSDGTVEIAHRFRADVHIQEGIYPFGLDGARNLGLRLGSGNYHWFVDSDNAIVESNALQDLVAPFSSELPVRVSMASPLPEPLGPSFSNWIELREGRMFARLRRCAERQDGWWFARDLAVGLTNCSVLRSESIRKVGGWDSDVRVLQRLRKAGAVGAALPDSAHFFHRSVMSPGDFYRKYLKRISRFAKWDPNEVSEYFVEPFEGHEGREAKWLTDVLTAPPESALELLQGNSSDWKWGLVYPLLVAAIVMRNPLAFLRMRRNVNSRWRAVGH